MFQYYHPCVQLFISFLIQNQDTRTSHSRSIMFQGNRLLMYAAMFGVGSLTTYYTLAPLVKEGSAIKKIRMLEKEGRLEEARELAKNTEFKEFKVSLIPKVEESSNDN